MSGLTLADLRVGDQVSFGGDVPDFAAQTFTVDAVTGHGFGVHDAGGKLSFFTAQPGLDLSAKYAVFRASPWPALAARFPLSLRLVPHPVTREGALIEAAEGSRFISSVSGEPLDPVDELILHSPHFVPAGQVRLDGTETFSVSGSAVTERALRDVIRAQGWALALFDRGKGVRAVIEFDRAGDVWKSAGGRGVCGAVAVGRALRLSLEASGRHA